MIETADFVGYLLLSCEQGVVTGAVSKAFERQDNDLTLFIVGAVYVSSALSTFLCICRQYPHSGL